MATYIPLSALPFQFQDTVTSRNMSGGSIEFYLAGTNTPTNLFSDSAGTSIGTSITLNSGGMPESGGNVITLWRDESIALKLVLKSAAGAVISTSNNLPAASLPADPADLSAVPFYDRTLVEIAALVTPTNYQYESGDVRRYGAVGDGITDNTAAISNAILGAGVAGEVIFPATGIFLCDGSLTGLNFQTWRGKSYEQGAGGSQAALKSSKTSGRFITTGASTKFENLRFLGVVSYTDATGVVTGSTTVGITATETVTFRDCVFQLQFICIETVAAYYVRIYGGEVTRCAVFLDMADADVFNFQIDGTIFRLCSVITTSSDTPERYVHNLKVMGGSFEGWTTLFNNVRSASLFGTYFESDIEGGFGFYSDASSAGGTGIHISLVGCFLFLNNLDRFVNFSGVTVASTFVSIGNTICGSVDSGEDQNYFVPADSNGRVIMLGDFLDDRGTGTGFHGTYVSDTSKVRNQLIVWPRGTTADHANVGQTWIDGGIISKPIVLAVDSAPSVGGGSIFLTGGAATITDFVDGVEGQIIRIVAEHAVTITDGTNIFLSGSANFVMAATDTLTLLCKADGLWYELGRSDNT
jgi:hypothetical protein